MKKIIFTLIFLIPVSLFAQKEEKNLPSVPTNFSVEQVSKEILINWDVPESDGGVTIDGYIVSYAENGGASIENQTAETEYVISSPTPDTVYEISVRAFNLNGEGQSTDTITITFYLSNDTPPEIIGDVAISNISNSSADVSWATDKPATTEIFYDVHQENQHGFYTTRSLHTDHVINLTELVPCTSYFFVVGGEDGLGNTYSSSVSSFRTSGCVGQVTSEGVGNLVAPDSVNEFSFDNSMIEIVANPGTVGRDSVFQVKRLSVSSVDSEVGCPAGAKPLGENIYDIKLIENYDAIASLQNPVSVTVSYGDEDLDSISEDSLSLYHLTEGVGWQKLDSCTVNKDDKTLTCQISNFSKFMIMGEKNCYFFSNDLLFGSYHRDVIDLNKFLIEKGFIDPSKKINENNRAEFFGFKTLRGLKSFQKENNISGWEFNFGVLGPKTRMVINNQKIN